MPRAQQDESDRTDRRRGDQSPTGRTVETRTDADGTRPRDSGLSGWFANATARIGITIVGFALLLFALGQAVGADLLGLAVDAVTSQTGRWLVVAAFALLLIVGAQRGLRRSRRA